jgi:hypothetical protein
LKTPKKENGIMIDTWPRVTLLAKSKNGLWTVQHEGHDPNASFNLKKVDRIPEDRLMVVPEAEEGIEMGGYIANENNKPVDHFNESPSKIHPSPDQIAIG